MAAHENVSPDQFKNHAQGFSDTRPEDVVLSAAEIAAGVPIGSTLPVHPDDSLLEGDTLVHEGEGGWKYVSRTPIRRYKDQHGIPD